MDVLVLIDKLDDLVHNAKAVPLTDQVRIDREEIYDILDQMRATIPEEIKQARWIVKERQEMLAEAKREVDRIVGEAREQAVREASQTEIVKLAERQAQEIVDDARRQARETRLEMEDWADGILSTLEVNLDKFLSAVKRGRERLHERSQETVVAGVGPIEREPEEETTYLGIEVAMRTFPPLLMLSLRFLVAGALLWALVGRGTRPTLRHWRSAVIVGGALLLFGNGGVALGQETIDTGVAALIVASVPLWLAVLDRVVLGQRLSRLAGVGLAVGVVGVWPLLPPP